MNYGASIPRATRAVGDREDNLFANSKRITKRNQVRVDDIKHGGSSFASAQHFGFVLLKEALGLANDIRISQHLFT